MFAYKQELFVDDYDGDDVDLDDIKESKAGEEDLDDDEDIGIEEVAEKVKSDLFLDGDDDDLDLDELDDD